MPDLAFVDDQGCLEFTNPPSAESRPGEEWATMGSQDFINKVYESVGIPFTAKKHLKAAPKQVYLGLLNDLRIPQWQAFHTSQRRNTAGTMGRLETDERRKKYRCGNWRSPQDYRHTHFLLMRCFDQIARGGLRSFFDWISENVEVTSLWQNMNSRHFLTPSVLAGMEFFLRMIPKIKPALYSIGIIVPRRVVAYSHAEWTPAANLPLLPSKGLEGCIWSGNLHRACAVDTPMEMINAWAVRTTQIVPLELLAAIGTLLPFHTEVRGKDVIFFIDNQSVCAALPKGASTSCNVEHRTEAWHALCATLECRVWIEWIPSEGNPADILSRKGIALFSPSPGRVEEMKLIVWADQHKFHCIEQILDLLESDERDASFAPVEGPPLHYRRVGWDNISASVQSRC